MQTDQDAFEVWASEHPFDLQHPKRVWSAALAWLRSQGEPIATLHDDGYWTWKNRANAPHESNYAGWRMDVFAAPQPAIPDGWLDRGKAALAECRVADDLWSDDRLLSHLFNAMTAGWQSKASRDVLAERRRQVEAEGWTPDHDDEHADGELAEAAACYCCSTTPVGVPDFWPWHHDWWKPEDPRRNLVKAGALILAEIERLDRTSTAAPEPRK